MVSPINVPGATMSEKDTPFRVWLGTGAAKLRRINALNTLAEKYAGTTRRGKGGEGRERPNVSKLLQMIADGELEITLKK